MPITAICPKCESRYQFDAALVGQKIRCTNPKCREIFEVREAAEPKGAKPRDRRAPTFDADSGEHQPMKAAAADSPREADWSKLPPPPVRAREEEVFEGDEITATAPGDPEVASADEALAFMGMAPAAAAEPAVEDYTLPTDSDQEVVYEVEDDEVATDYDAMIHHYKSRPKRRWAAYAVLGLFLLTGAAVAGAFMYMSTAKKKQRNNNIAAAMEELSGKRYKAASTKIEPLITEDKENSAKWKFLWDYAKAMDAATDTTQEAEPREKAFITYVTGLTPTDAEKIKEYQADVKDVFVRLADTRVTDADKKAVAQDFAAADAGLAKANDTKKMIALFGAVPAELEKKYADLVEKLGEGRRFDQFLTKITADLTKPTPAGITKAKADAKEAGYSGKPSIIELFKKADDAVVAMIVFKSTEKPHEKPQPVELTSVIIGPNTDPIPEKPSVVFAVARGVLYALAEGKGQIVWAARVGIDMASLPVRVPASGNIPQLVLVPSADGLGLTAREALTGKARWFQRLPAPMRGQPLLVEGRIVAPLADDNGTVMVLEARDGDLHGYIPLGQRIGAGAALQPGSTRVFIPAESQNVFVLDANPPLAAAGTTNVLLKLIDLIGTGHAPGSLRSEPVVVGGIDPATGQPTGTGYLILTLSEGFAEMRLRSYSITPQADGKLTLGASDSFPLPGWCWFAPVCDEERIAVVTDAGALAVLGINQQKNEDRGLFPLVVNTPKTAGSTAGRGQIVHAEEQGFWYLANGEMNYMIKGLNAKDGQKLAPGWRAPIKLGTPLHAAQASADRQTLYVVTQTSSPPSWQMTAVNAKSGSIVWQRPLGLAAHGDPIKLGENVYQIDQAAGIYAYDAKTAAQPAGPEAALTGQVLARPRTDIVGEPYFLRHPNGQMAFVVFATAAEGRQQLNAVVVQAGQNASAPVTVALPAALAGAPAITADNTFVLALADGQLYRWKFQAPQVEPGLNWRAARAGGSARAYLTLLPNDGVLVTDGVRGLTQYQWPAGGASQLKSGGIQVRDRIVSAPVLLPVVEGKIRVAVADAGGRLSLLEGDPLGNAASQTWEMRGLRKGNEITAGPFLVDDKGEPRIIVVADRTTVVCLKLDDRREVWSYKTKGDGVPLPPRQIDAGLIIADVAGRYEALGVADGAPLSTPYPSSPLPAAPAAAPLQVGDKIFAPLTDGTILLIPAAELLPGKK